MIRRWGNEGETEKHFAEKRGNRYQPISLYRDLAAPTANMRRSSRDETRVANREIWKYHPGVIIYASPIEGI